MRQILLLLISSVFLVGLTNVPPQPAAPAKAPAEEKEFNKPIAFAKETFDKAVENNSFVLLHFYAKWCFMCKAQKPILKNLLAKEKQFQNLVALEVPYDDSVPLREEFGRPPQSTLIILHGKKEVARSSRLTQEEDIKSFLQGNFPRN